MDEKTKGILRNFNPQTQTLFINEKTFLEAQIPSNIHQYFNIDKNGFLQDGTIILMSKVNLVGRI